MKKIISLVILFGILFSLALPLTASAQEPVYLYVNGKAVLGADGFIDNGRTMVPVRAVAEKMNAEVLWIESESKVVLNKACDKMEYNGTIYENVVASCELILGKAEIRIKLLKDDQEIFNILRQIDCIAYTVNGRTHIPARYVGYALGYSVEYQKKITGHTVYYDFIEKQTIDFEANSELIVRINYDYDKEKYPEKVISYDVEYPARKGYSDVVVVDTTNGKLENGQFTNMFPYRFTKQNYTMDSEEEQYRVSNAIDPEKNLRNFVNLYKDKTGEPVEEITASDGTTFYRTTFLTEVSNVIGHGEDTGSFIFLKDTDVLGPEFAKYKNDCMVEKKQFYRINALYPIYNYEKVYYYNEEDIKLYGFKDDSLLRQGTNKNTLLFLNKFLGEDGQKIWKMMSDYFVMDGHCYVAPDTEEKNVVVVTNYFHPQHLGLENTTYTNTTAPVPKSLLLNDRCTQTRIFAGRSATLSKEVVEKYGLKFVEQQEILEGSQCVLIVETDKQRVYIEYHPICIDSAMLAGSGYSVLFESIED